jgi:hypothetical protein
MADNTVTEKFIADVSAFVRDVQRAAHEADQFGNANSSAGLAARRMGIAAAEAAAKAEKAQLAAYEAAKKLERGELDAAKAAQVYAVAAREVEKASIKDAESMRAAAKAADEEAQQLHQLGRAAAEAAAMEELSRLRANKSINDHNSLLRRMRSEYKDFGKDIKELETIGARAFGLLEKVGTFSVNAIFSAGNKLVEMGPLWLGGIVAGISALPLIATVAAGAITLGLGGALAYVGIKGALEATKVRQAWADTAADAKKQAAEWSKPWQPALIDIAHQFDGFVQRIGPTMSGVFAKMAPTVDSFATQAINSLDKLKPAITEVGNDFDKILQALGPNMPALMDSVSKGIIAFSQAAGDHSAEIVRMVLSLGQLVEITGKVTKALADLEPYIDPAANAMDILGVGAVHASEGLAMFGAGAAAAAVKTTGLTGAEQDVKNVMDLASQSADQLKTSLDALAGKNLSAREAAVTYGKAVETMTAAIRANGAAHGFNTQKGLENEAALNRLAKAALDNEVAMRADGRSAGDVAKFMSQAREKIYNAAREMGYNKQQADALATKLTGVSRAAASIKSPPPVVVRADISQAVQAAQNLQSIINGIFSGRAYGGPIHAPYGRAQGGPVYALAGGGSPSGPVHGPGTSTSDSIPAWLSDGEFVVSAAAYQANTVLVNAINAAHGRPVNNVMVPSGGHFDTMKPLPMPSARRHYDETLTGSSGGGSRPVVQNHNYYIAGSVWSEQELLNVLQGAALQRGISLTLPAGR